ncbi:Dephospho-CoA kinase [Gossypium australe]|uniref:Dephospho-CoA kinase n=1 Tax=Gossypium australe TaxID=47621 RepID=A0A5B6VXV8_9ROSI|nr:Dephospho-CoA kinase [Gossypium australe]
MLKGKGNSSFGWDEHMRMVVAEDVLWNSYITTGKYVQTTIDIVEEIDAENVATAKNLEEGSNDHRCEANVSLDKMHILPTQAQLSKLNQDDSTFSKKKKKRDF